ncbi:MFS transporter [Thermaurantimonas aggregans]|uniref:MFS transporter n=1 Tax=Thermaurantimonas aggregans TaxID=2173829 RepID=A0A401XMZ1_9FLAO|nr:MFS transporter [Thermaurantimonas aggregans]MCX8148141.1 MFS transporter [Thermaurantimonas aggregans]GCD78368.1 MFS transporter [Thermaurantimonas aggregans]
MPKKLYFTGFLLVTFASQAIWITFAPVASRIASEVGTTPTYIGMLAVLYPIFFLILSLPAGRRVDSNLKKYMLIAALLTAASAIGRFISQNLVILYFCQTLAAVAQPFVLNGFVPVAHTLFPSHRSRALSALSIAMYSGMAFSLLTGVYLYERFGMHGLLWPSAITGLFGLVLIAVFNKSIDYRSLQSKVKFSEIKTLMTSKPVLLLGSILGLGVGTFDNLSTWLEPALRHTEASNTAGSAMGMAILAGILSVSPVVGIVSKRGWHTRYLHFATLAVSGGMYLLSTHQPVWLIKSILIFGGSAMFPAYPIILELVAERYVSVGLATGAVGMISRLITVTLTVSAALFISGPKVFFTYLSIPVLLGFFLIFFYEKTS